MPDGQQHIVVVEDERVIAEILVEYLRQCGYKTTHIADGGKAVTAINTLAPDLVLLDLMLPNKDGMQICKEVRAFSPVPIIMITAKVDEIDRLLGLEIGADDYICKPFSPREVVARVKALFRRVDLEKAGGEKIPNPIVIDDVRTRITVNGERLDLTPTEYRLLKLLVTNAGRVYSRDQLLDLCYQQEQATIDRVIDSHIKNLRKKLSKVMQGREVIHAVYGMGYRFEL